MNQQTVNAFRIRQLSPFRGVLQVFLNDTARALSGNGQLWEIQVLSDRPQGLWAYTPFSGRQFYTFGLWTIEGRLIADYIRWKAPQLLLLPYLSQATRERLECLAVDQAEAVDRLWRLYPQIHNQALLNRARVEARIRTANRTQ